MKISLAEKAYEILQKKIITLEFIPGQQLDEKYLAEILDLGRTPIREALLKLASEYMVESVPKKGFVVSHLTFQNVKCIFEILRILEKGVADLAVQQEISNSLDEMQSINDQFKLKIDKKEFLQYFWFNHEFHMIFANCSKNDYLIQTLKAIRNEVNRLTFMSFNHQNPDGEEFSKYNFTVHDEHQRIIDYLRTKDSKNLKKTIEHHIQNFQQRVVAYLTN